MAKITIEKVVEWFNEQPVVQQKIYFLTLQSRITENIINEQKRLEEEANGHKDFIQKINNNG